jgi:hypothetical protein
LKRQVNIALSNQSVDFGVILVSYWYYYGVILVILLFVCHLYNFIFVLHTFYIWNITPGHQLTKHQSKIKEGYKPLKLPFILHNFPPNFFEYLPSFNGEDHVTTKKRMEAFECFTNNLEIIHEDVFMRTFSQSLHRNARIWFRNLKVDSIGSWIDFHDCFMIYWSEKKSYV